MKHPKRINKVFKWMIKGGLIGLPFALSSTLALGQRLTWVGAVLLWFYTGRVLRQRETPEDQTTQVDPMIDLENNPLS